MTLPILVDAHCHLDFPDFDDERSAVIDRARAAGVTRMVTICTKLPNAPRVAAIADTYDGVFWAAGVHPMSVGEHAPVTVEELVTLAQHPKFVGIGETGLDYHYTAETKAAQQDSLRLHIEACRQTKLPLIIHARDADDDMARILREEYDAGKYTCMMHCFSSTRALAEAALDMDFYLSMSGIAAFPKSKELRDIFKDAPLDRILTETDSPYLAPPPFRGRRNEPAYTAHTAQVGADTFELSLDDFAKATSANFDRLFWKAA
jgi:TatD DNase family protein